MNRGPLKTALKGAALAGLVVLAACGAQPVQDAAYFVANPDRIEPVLADCEAGRADAEVCAQVARAQSQIARSKRQEAYRRVIEGEGRSGTPAN